MISHMTADLQKVSNYKKEQQSVHTYASFMLSRIGGRCGIAATVFWFVAALSVINPPPAHGKRNTCLFCS